jgi:hypothetical protein
MRKDYFDIRGRPGMDKKKALRDLKIDWKKRLGSTRSSTGSVALYTRMATSSKELYPLIYKVMAGETETKYGLKARVMRSGGWYTPAISGIPEEVVVQYLQNVVDGRWDTQLFGRECKTYQARMMLDDLVFKTINATAGQNKKYEVVQDVRDEFPLFDTLFRPVYDFSLKCGQIWKQVLTSKLSIPDAVRDAVKNAAARLIAGQEEFTPVSFVLFLLFVSYSLLHQTLNCLGGYS